MRLLQKYETWPASLVVESREAVHCDSPKNYFPNQHFINVRNLYHDFINRRHKQEMSCSEWHSMYWSLQRLLPKEAAVRNPSPWALVTLCAPGKAQGTLWQRPVGDRVCVCVCPIPDFHGYTGSCTGTWQRRPWNRTGCAEMRNCHIKSGICYRSNCST